MDGLCYIVSQVATLFDQSSPLVQGLIIGLLAILAIECFKNTFNRIPQGATNLLSSKEFAKLLSDKDENVSINVKHSEIEITKNGCYCCLFPNWQDQENCTNERICSWIEKTIKFL